MISQERFLKIVPGESSNVITFLEVERKLTLDSGGNSVYAGFSSSISIS
jgi:hypothetical protein